jgi:uncharacterized protein YbaP (TraB family)
VQKRLDILRVPARAAPFKKFTFGGLSSNVRRTAAMSLAAFFIAAPQPALGSLPSSATIPASVTVRAAGPALWVVQDRDTTIFLFGTFHALDSNTAWFDRSVRAAFDSSDELVLETLVPEDPAELHAALSGQSLVSEPQVGQPVYADRGASSFVASAGQAMSAGRSVGMSVDQGADAVLRRAANSSGKPVAGLESFAFQLNMFRTLPPAPPQAARHTGSGLPNFIDNMQSAWKRGDNDGFASLLGTMRSQSPQTYQTLFVSRNINWAGWIANRMTLPGTVFVAVGTGHLVGPDSVQQQLAARGITSARIS